MADRFCAACGEPAPAREEYDLDSPEDCVEWILANWGEKRRSEIEPAARFYVSQLKAAKGSLSEVFCMKIIGPRLLCTRESRSKWLAAAQSNREKRFVPPPDKVWQKKQ